jgi:S-DNA-T family DNA segregation ATPase FtsK/SpoIIIE
MSNKTKDTKQKDGYKKDISAKDSDNVFSLIKKAIKSEQFPMVVAVFLVIFTVFCFISFVSFFFTWFSDYSLIQDISFSEVFHGERDIQNWCGPVGAIISYLFIRDTFGIASFGFILIFILISLKVFRIKIYYFSRWIMSTMIIMLWLSCVFGYFVVAFDFIKIEDFAGVVGVIINQWLVGVVGKIGTCLIHLAFTITIPMLLFGVKYLWLTSKIKTIKTPTLKQIANITKEKDIEGDLVEDETDNPFNEDNQEDDVNQEKDSKEYNQETEIEEITPNQETPIEQEVVKEEPVVVDKTQIRQTSPIVPNAVNLTQEQEQEMNSFVVRRVNQQEDKQEKEISDDNVTFVVNDNSEADNVVVQSNEQEDKEHLTIDMPYDPHLDLPHYVFPDTNLLIDYDLKNTRVSDEELVANKDRIVKTLKNYSIDITKISATPGPTVTLYEIVPAPGIRISKIKNLQDDIALSLSALGIRIIAPIPGKGTIGIEVPNSKPQIVSMKSMLECNLFKNNKFELPIAIGRTISNEPFVVDLAKMPHILMAGATGQGKSVGLNSIITSLLYTKHPSELKFVMVDPKKVELSLYSTLEKHYLAKIPDNDEAIITDVKKVVRTLKSLCKEMDTRYDLLKDAQCKKITEYNKKFLSRQLNPNKGHYFMPYIVLVIDEFADLIMTAGKEIETPICRLAQLARAVGIHLIIATQRPSVNIITGSIKTNFPARAAFKVSSMVDSRTILDSAGAEQLIGRGDMLFSADGKITRLQCALIETDEIEKIGHFIGDQRGYNDCFLLPDCPEESNDVDQSNNDFDNNKLDDRFEEAARLIVATQQGSTSLIQRKLALGYNRAGRIMDQLEQAGIVGSFQGSKAREVLVKSDIELDDILNQLLGR